MLKGIVKRGKLPRFKRLIVEEECCKNKIKQEIVLVVFVKNLQGKCIGQMVTQTQLQTYTHTHT